MPRCTAAERRTVFIFAYLFMVLFGFALQSLPPLFELIRVDIPFDHTKAGFLMAAFGLPGFVMPLAAAWLAVRFDRKKLSLAGLLLMAAGALLFACAGSLPLLVAGRVLTGVGGAILLIMAPLFINDAFGGGNLGRAIGLFNTGVPLGLVLAVNIVPRLGSLLGWRGVMFAIPALLAAIGLLFILFFRVPETREGGEDLPEQQRGAFPRGIWLLALINLLLNAGTVPFSTFAAEYLRGTGMSAAQTGFLISFVMIETAVLGPLIGIMVDKETLHRRLIVAASILISSAFILMLMPGVGMFAGALFLGAGSAIVPVTMFPLLARVAGRERVGTGLGILMTASSIGNNLGLGAFGLVIDRLGGFQPGFLMLSAIGLMISPVVLFIRLPRRDLRPTPS